VTYFTGFYVTIEKTDMCVCVVSASYRCAVTICTTGATDVDTPTDRCTPLDSAFEVTEFKMENVGL